MGRELKRVALDFDWPIDQLWKGYVNPYRAMDCKPCGRKGLNPETLKIDKEWYNFEGRQAGRDYNAWCYNITQDDVQALVDADRLWDFTRVPINDEQHEVVKKKLADGGNSWLPFDNGRIPTADEVNKWARERMGHDSINHHVCVKARAKREGVWGYCKYCNGEGEIWPTEEIKKAHDDWQDFDPPTGEGFQLWSTTTEGHPMSPVFKSLKELSEWCADNTSTFGSYTATAEEWYQMLDDDTVHHQEGNMTFI